jgi:hypothetical protein
VPAHPEEAAQVTLWVGESIRQMNRALPCPLPPPPLPPRRACVFALLPRVSVC